jgi:hypothetical protein
LSGSDRDYRRKSPAIAVIVTRVVIEVAANECCSLSLQGAGISGRVIVAIVSAIDILNRRRQNIGIGVVEC